LHGQSFGWNCGMGAKPALPKVDEGLRMPLMVCDKIRPLRIDGPFDALILKLLPVG
jgi:hypothetical protein